MGLAPGMDQAGFPAVTHNIQAHNFIPRFPLPKSVVFLTNGGPPMRVWSLWLKLWIQHWIPLGLPSPGSRVVPWKPSAQALKRTTCQRKAGSARAPSRLSGCRTQNAPVLHTCDTSRETRPLHRPGSRRVRCVWRPCAYHCALRRTGSVMVVSLFRQCDLATQEIHGVGRNARRFAYGR